MDMSQHTLKNLFAQLGLANSEVAMEAFIANNRLHREVPIEKAAFWSSAQAQFLREAIAEDADWAEVVDQLDALLRH
jgi:hypothetical protein